MGSSGCEVAGGERRVVVLGAVCAEEREAREAEQKTCVLFKIFGGQRCVRCAARDKIVVEGVD